jgi:hypothetical protein
MEKSRKNGFIGAGVALEKSEKRVISVAVPTDKAVNRNNTTPRREVWSHEEQ